MRSRWQSVDVARWMESIRTSAYAATLAARGLPIADAGLPLPAELSPPRRLGLALGGGGGKGGAHLGVLAVLEELELPIDLIVGTSIGGVVGILYSAGLSLDAIEQLFRAGALRRIAITDPTGTGFIGVRRREALLQQALGDRTFADLRVPCAVVTTDLVTGGEVVIDSGPLVPAILATTALPGVFPPVVHGSALLADGGILNNLPVDVADQMGMDKVIAVQLVAGGIDITLSTPEPVHSFGRLTLAPRQFALANRALGLLIAKTTELRLAQHPPALLLAPNVGHIGTLDMTRPEHGRAAGEVCARAAAEQLVALREWRNEPVVPVPPAQPPARAWPLPWWSHHTAAQK